MDASELERIICDDPALGEVRAGEVMFARGGEVVGTMASPNTEQELEEFLAAVDRVLQKRTGQGVRFTRRWRQDGMNVFVVIHATPGDEQPPPPAEPSPPILPAPPDFAPHTRRMAEADFERAVVFWDRGTLYVLWVHDLRWEAVSDESPPGSGIDWLAGQQDLGEVLMGEVHGDGGLVEQDGVVWLKAPSDGDVFALLSDGSWQIVEA